MNPTSVVETQPVQEKQIYGGVSEIIPNIDLNQKTNHQIYGGADPLENTQTLTVTPSSEPVVEIQPVVEATPQVDNVQPVSIPSVDVVATEQPTVNAIPTVAEVSQASSSNIDSLMP